MRIAVTPPAPAPIPRLRLFSALKRENRVLFLDFSKARSRLSSSFSRSFISESAARIHFTSRFVSISISRVDIPCITPKTPVIMPAEEPAIRSPLSGIRTQRENSRMIQITSIMPVSTHSHSIIADRQNLTGIIRHSCRYIPIHSPHTKCPCLN